MVTVILNGYKRSSHFEKQLNAIKNQTLRPKEIMLWQNKGDEFDSDLTNQTTHANCNKNLGVWARFAFALNAKTEYICIFDDDTIPGSKWLENCYNTIQTHDGLLGTIGVNFLDQNNYMSNVRVGWDRPNENTEVVDIVGHSWFFKREDLATFWRELPDLNHSPLVGEDMHFSYTLQKYTNKKTYVPPHPPSDMEMWGSKPDVAWSIGTDEAAISRDWNNMITMNQAFIGYINKGFKLLKT
tara:strand:- start:1160 stop:1882 length:723 start_codon:yes stop_codon:yes gene_type:complete